MTDKQIIDGVDVSKCSWYKQGATGMICADWLLSNDCSKNLNCYYKQLKRKEQECKLLKSALKNQNIVAIVEENDQLKAENEELKKKVSYYEKDRAESHKTNVHNLVLIKRYKQALDKFAKTVLMTSLNADIGDK